MKNKWEKEFRAYQKEVSKRIPRNYPQKKKLLKTLFQNISDFMEEHPSASWEDVIAEFGSSSEVADDFMEELSGTDVAKTFQQKRHHTILLAAGCLFGMILFCLLLLYVRNWYLNETYTTEETLYVFDGTEIPTEWQNIIMNGDNTDE